MGRAVTIAAKMQPASGQKEGKRMHMRRLIRQMHGSSPPGG